MTQPRGLASASDHTYAAKCQHQAPRLRRGTATVELAIITPLLMLLTLGTLDICSMIFLKEAATLAAYEGARNGIEKGKTNDDAIESVITFLKSRDIKHSSSNCVKISTPSFDDAETLQHVSVTVTLPIKGNLLIAPQVVQNLKLSAKVTMRKEYENTPSS
ncbi:MAG: TadE/TadG family type IV pilus assembly protein [Rubripirellula sp.]